MSGIYFPNYRLGPLDNSSACGLGLLCDNLVAPVPSGSAYGRSITVQFTDLS